MYVNLEQISTVSIADKETYCAFYDKSIKFLPLVEHILRVISRCGGKLDLTSDDL